MKTFLARKREASGQSVVELLLSLFVFFTIFFMFVQVALSFGVANYIQYATFMSARALLAAHSSENRQKEAAARYMSHFVGNDGRRFGSIVEPDGGAGEVEGATIGRASRVQLAPSQQARLTAWEQGVTFRFKTKLYMAPLIPGIARGDSSKVRLESQSWLGREPTEEDCERVLERRAQQVGAQGAFLYDNGC